MVDKKDYEECVKYINKTWKELTFKISKDRGVHIALPNKFIQPSIADGIFWRDMFYWDSYFIILGILEEGQVKLAKGIVENFKFLYDKFSIIPSRNRYYNIGISQPPFFTSMIREVYEKTKDKRWLRKMVVTAEKEYAEYWMDKEIKDEWMSYARKFALHRAFKSLSRYADHNIIDDTAEHESGWDMTSRFNDKCLDYIPIDLNSLLYKYEKDFEFFFSELGNEYRSKKYSNLAKYRKELINHHMWDDLKGFYFDFNHAINKKSNFFSLAGFYPMWAKIATREQAEAMVKNLKVFEQHYGLTNTQHLPDSMIVGSKRHFKQWDYPNGWAPNHWIVIKGLLNYGYIDEAKRIAKKWLDLNKKVFKETGKFWEKYEVITGEVGRPGRYPNQEGFGWTNGVFLKILGEFS